MVWDLVDEMRRLSADLLIDLQTSRFLKRAYQNFLNLSEQLYCSIDCDHNILHRPDRINTIVAVILYLSQGYVVARVVGAAYYRMARIVIDVAVAVGVVLVLIAVADGTVEHGISSPGWAQSSFGAMWNRIKARI